MSPNPVPGRESRESLRTALEENRLTSREIWLECLGRSGNSGMLDLEAYIYGLVDLPPYEAMVLECAFKEALHPNY